MSLNWDDLRVFQSIAEAGSLSAAGRRLGLSQPTIGRRLQSLEEELGAKLFDRHSEGYRLSLKGAALLPLVEDMVRASEAIERSRLRLEDTVAGPVRLSTDPWNCRFISRRLDELLAELPGIELELITAYSFANLSRREADLAIRNQRPTEGRLASRGLPDADHAVYGSRRYVAAHPDAFTDARYARCRWIGYDETLDHFVSARWVAQRIGRQPHLRYSSAAHFMDALLGNVGLAVIPCFLGSEEPELVRVSPIIKELRPPNQWLVVHQDMRDAPRVRLAADKIAGLFQRYRDVLQPPMLGDEATR
jgi:DNA-binding transcriptional LysR family regulator